MRTCTEQKTKIDKIDYKCLRIEFNIAICLHIFCCFYPQYGGDQQRKRKLLKQQAEGKKRMRKIGNIDVPKDAFIKIL